MDKELRKLENCLKEMKKCLKIPDVEKCICFSNVFGVFDLELNKLNKKLREVPRLKTQQKLLATKKEIERIKKIIVEGNKECIGCNPCKASLVFNTYPDALNNLYLDNKL